MSCWMRKNCFGRLVISIQLVDLLLWCRKYNQRNNWKSTHNDGGNKTKLLRQQKIFLGLKCKQSNDFHSKCAFAVFSIVLLFSWQQILCLWVYNCEYKNFAKWNIFSSIYYIWVIFRLALNFTCIGFCTVNFNVRSNSSNYTSNALRDFWGSLSISNQLDS